jgi:ADP-ribose pyrophosphatase YjhB (NUDIX family)
MRHREDAALECASCSYRYYHSAVAAVVGIVQHEDKIIITRRANDPGKGLLAIPGGFVEHGETLEQTLVRELHEELNLDVTDPVYLASFASQYLFGDVLYQTAVAYFVVTDADITNARAADDIDHFQLVKPDDIDGSTLAFEADKMALLRYHDWRTR